MADTETALLRQAGPDDAEAIAALAARTFPLACPPTTSPEDIAEHVATELTADRFRQHLAESLIVVAEIDQMIIGYTMMTDTPAPVEVSWRRPLEVRRIYVDEALHGRGIGDALMEQALAEAVLRGADHVWLGTNEHNVRAIAFYRRHGFDVVGRRTFFVAGSKECDYVMGREI